MKKLYVAFALVLGLNMISSIISLTAPVSYAQEAPEPEKPEKPAE